MANTPIVFRRDDSGAPIIPNRFQSLSYTTAQATNATYNQPWIDSTLTFFTDPSGYAGPTDVNFVSGSAYSDQAGTLYLDQTDDYQTVLGNANNYFSTSVAVSAATLAEFQLTNLKHRWYRFRYVNGANPQTTFILSQLSERIDAFDQMSLSGSIAPDSAGIPVLLDTIPYSSFSASTQLNKWYMYKCHRNAKRRTVWIRNTLDQDCSSTYLGILDTTWNVSGDFPVVGASLGTSPHPKTTSWTSQAQSVLTPAGDSLWVQLGMGATAPTTGNVYIYLEEVF